MRHLVELSSLIPSRLVVENLVDHGVRVVMTASGEADGASCPCAERYPGGVHSRYERRASDLPCSRRRVLLRIGTCRFRCTAPQCRREIFMERFGDGFLPARVRRTARRSASSTTSVSPSAVGPAQTSRIA